MLEDKTLDAIFIVTRHHTHADLVCRALETGKAVFVEKPLALTREELDRIVEVVANTGNDRLMVGFNRRFAPLLTQMRSQFGPACSSAVMRYLVSAGPLAADSWYGNDALEGSRFTGEGGHFIDTLSWWAGSLPEEVYAVPGPEKDDVQVTVRFQNGSSGVISYLTAGNTRFPKETFDAAGGGRSARLDNFRKATVWAGRGHSTNRARGQDKGQRRRTRPVCRGEPDRRGDADPARGPDGRHQGNYRRAREPVERTAGAGMSATRISRLGWYARRAAAMSPAEVAWRARDQVLRAAWSRRQVTREQLDADMPPPAGEREFAAILPAGHRGTCSRGGQGGCP